MSDPARSQVVSWLKRFLDGHVRKAKVSQGHKGISLLEWDVGRPAQVVDIAVREPGRLARLSSLGLVPGSVVTIRQRKPTYIVQVDATEWALDASIAAQIFVEELRP